jgi:hypothetical protein
MRGLTTEELEAERAEELPARGGPGSHETWQDVGPQFYSMK